MSRANSVGCKTCGKQVVDTENQLCRSCHIAMKQETWLDNTDPDNLGIVKWCHECLPEFAHDKSPWFHIELFYDLLSLYNPIFRNKYERLYEFISFRGSAKSTAANTLFVSYILAHNGRKIRFKIDGEIKEFLIEEKTICIISETAGSAEEFTVRIRDAFSTSQRLLYYYHFQISEALDSVTGQWTRTAFKINGCYVQGVGSGQQIRGKVKGAYRPTLVIADDIYSEKNTITEESRAKTKQWWTNAVMNSIDDKLGKVLVLGTIVHDDTILVDLEHNDQWRTKKVQMMDIEKFHELIKEHTTVDWDTNNCVLPFEKEVDRVKRSTLQRAYFNKVQAEQDWKLAWEERIDLYFVALKYKEAVFNGTVSGFYQEYFHITRSPEDKRFKPEFFQHLKRGYEFKHENGYNWLNIKGEDKWHHCNIEFGIDIAGKGKDDAVISVIASLPDLRVIVLHQALGKWSIRDFLYGDTSEDKRYSKVCLDRTKVRKIGIVDEAFRLSRRFHPSKIKIGIAAEEGLIHEEMTRVFQENYDYTTYIMERKQTVKEGKKETRIAATLLPYYETMMVYHAHEFKKLEYQLEFLGKSDHDDCADAAECAFYRLEYPEELDYDYFGSGEKTDITELYKLRNTGKEFNMFNNWREYQ